MEARARMKTSSRLGRNEHDEQVVFLEPVLIGL